MKTNLSFRNKHIVNKPLIYQFKVSLKNIKPLIWRRLLLPSNASFWELHIAIQDSFGWQDYHLHEFFEGSIYNRGAFEIKIPHPEDDIYGENREIIDESKTLLSDIFSEKQKRLTYVYDFGDNWEHLIELEKLLPYEKEEVCPQVIGGKRACPWEDSGGPWGYGEKIKILKNPKHKEYLEITDWLEIDSFDDLDLESFDPESVVFRNQATELRKLIKAIERECG